MTGVLVSALGWMGQVGAGPAGSGPPPCVASAWLSATPSVHSDASCGAPLPPLPERLTPVPVAAVCAVFKYLLLIPPFTVTGVSEVVNLLTLMGSFTAQYF